jgi:hypothetical protein
LFNDHYLRLTGQGGRLLGSEIEGIVPVHGSRVIIVQMAIEARTRRKQTAPYKGRRSWAEATGSPGAAFKRRSSGTDFKPNSRHYSREGDTSKLLGTPELNLPDVSRPANQRGVGDR